MPGKVGFIQSAIAAAILAFSQTAIAPSQLYARDFPAQGIKSSGTTYNRAQVLDWINDTTFAIGRWDGSITIFRTPTNGEYGPVIIQAAAAPSGHGIEMLSAMDGATLVTSDGSDRLALWRKSSADGPLSFIQDLQYDPKFGTANSATVAMINGETRFVSGHENGFILIWRPSAKNSLELVDALDIHSAAPISSPIPLRNVRGLVSWKDDYVIAGSEDGDIVGIKLSEKREVFRTRYNAAAQRGINSISLLDKWLLVANCSVGAADKNIWLFDLSSGQPVLRDSENLVLDSQRAQTFNFDAILLKSDGSAGFFSSTEEGLLWEGKIDDDQLIVTGVTKIAPDGGAILREASNGGMLAAAAYQIWLFRTP
jgi:hypothetical protein